MKKTLPLSEKGINKLFGEYNKTQPTFGTRDEWLEVDRFTIFLGLKLDEPSNILLAEGLDMELFREFASPSLAGRMYWRINSFDNQTRPRFSGYRNPTNITALCLYGALTGKFNSQAQYTLQKSGPTIPAWAETYLHHKGILESRPYVDFALAAGKLKNGVTSTQWPPVRK